MEKEEKIQGFLRSLKTSFKNASIYREGHPIFRQSVEMLQHGTEALLGFMIPIYIGFTPKSIYIEGKYREGDQLYEELARIFHYRKIRSFEINEGVTLNELMEFVSRLSVPPKEIIIGGGPDALLKDDFLFIKLEELDYSELLKGEGEEIKDIWINLVAQALKDQDRKKIIELSKSFNKVIRAFSVDEIMNKEGLVENMTGFFNSLKECDESRFHECSKDFLRAMMGKKESYKDHDFEKLQTISAGFLEKDVATTLWEEILTNENFDTLEFNILTRLIENKKHDAVAFSITNIYKKTDALNSNPDVRSKIEELLSESSSPLLSKIYRNTLTQLLKDISFAGEMSFDHDTLYENYLFILINRVHAESDKKKLLVLLTGIMKIWDKAKDKHDFESLKILHEVLIVKDSILGAEPEYQRTNRLLREFIERSMLEGEISLFFKYFIRAFENSLFDVNVYLEAMFTNGKINPYTMMAFFRFFKEYMFYFNLNLDGYAADSRTMQKIMGGLQLVSPQISIVILKNIFQRCQRKEKIRVLRTMRELSLIEEKFLMPILKDKNPRLKGEALLILIQDEGRKKELLENFLLIKSPFGTRNKQILEHIKIIVKNDIEDAAPQLKSLTRRKHFWNRKVRKLGLKALENWNVS
jgi:hypothetical protein